MKEKELRIALVCFGGVSLAVYMHGITKEVLKLVRASGVLHAIRDRDERARASFFDKVNASDPEYDTDAIYFELLRDIGCSTVELRVIVDIVAGASAGGINGTMLARALSHDLPMGALRDLWLEHADVTDLLAPEARARVTSKVLLTPVVWFLGATGLWKAVKDPEVRRKVSLFVRSRWFKPPLSGARMAELMYNAATAMGRPKHSLASLMPSGQRLDLFVTVTDHYGYQQPVQIHDPPSSTSASIAICCGSVTSGGRTAKSSATSISRTRRRWPSRRGRPRRFRAPSRRRRSARWTNSSRVVGPHGRIAANSSHEISKPIRA